jgi:hypothetical protein
LKSGAGSPSIERLNEKNTVFMQLHKHTTLFIALMSCMLLLGSFTASHPEKEVKLLIRPMFGKEQLTLHTREYITANGDTVSVSKLRFYISALQFSFADGSAYTENNSYHLVDAADSTSLQVQLKHVPQKEIREVHFNIGVDSLASVSGALDGDLDPVKGMYWAWNSGYINAKLEGKSKSKNAADSGFEFHIGGYLAPYHSLRNITLLSTASQNNLVLIADAGAWFQHISLRKTNSIVMPCTEAMKMADDYTNMFHLEN